MKLRLIHFSIFVFFCGPVIAGSPNILWITCEDTSPHLGCYGDAFAATPQIDAMANESLRYTSAFAYTGVCAPRRSCLITGVIPLTLGSQHMRSTTRLPDFVKCLPEYLRTAGYYCSNNQKEDYNFKTPATAWDDSSKTAHWRNRLPGQPFFAVFNFTVCHESQVFCTEAVYQKNTKRLTPKQRHDPAKVVIPPIHPDTPEFRKEWAWHYDNVTAMDYQVGDVLKELRDDGLADDTIVFFFSDHGTGLPSIKMFAWGPSLQVPLLIRIPEKFRTLAPQDYAPAATTDRLVTFVDFAPSVLGLAGIETPAHMQGTAFLGPKAGAAREFIFGGKDRQGECFDTIRYVRDARFQYNRNFRPDVPFGQHMSYLWQHASMRGWEQLHREGKLSWPTSRFLAPTKPFEELYDVQRDPWQVNNLAKDPSFTGELKRVRALLETEMKRAGDLGLLPERELHQRAQASSPMEMGRDMKLNPLDKLLPAADLANQMNSKNVPQLIEMLRAPDSAVRWWGAIGLRALKEDAASAKDDLRIALQDSSPDVRIAAAESLLNLGECDEAMSMLEQVLKAESVFTRLDALTTVQRLGKRAKRLLPAIRSEAAAKRDPAHNDASDYVARMVGYLPEQLTE